MKGKFVVGLLVLLTSSQVVAAETTAQAVNKGDGVAVSFMEPGPPQLPLPNLPTCAFELSLSSSGNLGAAFTFAYLRHVPGLGYAVCRSRPLDLEGASVLCHALAHPEAPAPPSYANISCSLVGAICSCNQYLSNPLVVHANPGVSGAAVTGIQHLSVD